MESLGSHHACSHVQSLESASWTQLIPNTHSSIQLFFQELVFHSQWRWHEPIKSSNDWSPHPPKMDVIGAGLIGSLHACSHAQSSEAVIGNKLDPSTRSSITLWFPVLFSD
jgi:hypothetical protein